MPNNTDLNNDFGKDAARQKLLNELQKGLDDIEAGRTIPSEEVHAKLAKIFEGYDFE